jgi:hypothetical protein
MEMHIVFLLHGIGNHQKGWSDSISQAIKLKAIEYGNLTEQQANDKVEFVELLYNDILDQNIHKILSGGKSLGSFNQLLAKGYEDRYNPKPSNDSQTQTIGVFRDLALDLFCYMLNPEMTNTVLLKLAEIVLNKISLEPGSKYSFVAHSLGTKVSFDLLHRLFESNSKYYSIDKNSKNPVYGSPSIHSYYLLANVAPILNYFDFTNYNMNDSHVRERRPSSIPRQGGIISNAFRIFNNQYDPVAKIGLSNQINSNVYSQNSWFRFLSQANMHDYEQYIAHPIVHLNMLEDFYGIKAKNKDSIINDFKTIQVNEETKKQIDEMLNKINVPESAVSMLEFLKNIESITNQI